MPHTPKSEQRKILRRRKSGEDVQEPIPIPAFSQRLPTFFQRRDMPPPPTDSREDATGPIGRYFGGFVPTDLPEWAEDWLDPPAIRPFSVGSKYYGKAGTVAGPTGQIYPLTTETVAKGTSFWDLDDWAERSKRITAGAVNPLISLRLWPNLGVFEGAEEAGRRLTRDEGSRLEQAVRAVKELPQDVPWWQKSLAGLGKAFEKELRAIAAVEEATLPLRGLVEVSPHFGIEDPHVSKRYQIHRQSGMDAVSSLALAYEQSEEVPGEMSGLTEVVLGALFSPFELFPGIGIFGGLSKAALAGGLRAVGRRGAIGAAGIPESVATRRAASVPAALPSSGVIAATSATTMARGPGAKVGGLQVRYRQAVQDVRNLEARRERILISEKPIPRAGEEALPSPAAAARPTGLTPDPVTGLTPDPTLRPLPKIYEQLSARPDVTTPAARVPEAAPPTPATRAGAAPARAGDVTPTTPVTTYPAAAGSRAADQLIRGEEEFFLSTFDDQLAAAKATERSARIALRNAETALRGKTAKKALTQRDLAIGRQLPITPTRPGAAPIEDVTGVALTKAKPGVMGAIGSALERLGIGQSPVPPKSGRELAKIEAMWDEGGKPASRDFTDTYLKVQEYANDIYFGLRRLQTQVGKRIPIVAGGQYDLITLLTRGPGAANAGATRYALAIEEIKRIGPIQVNDVNTIIFANHGKFILAEKGAGRVLPGGLKSAEELDAGIAQLRARLTNEQFAQAEAGARVIQRIYQEERVRLAQAGFITDELAVDLAKRYPWYNPLKYVVYMDAQWRIGKSTKPFTVLSSGFRRLTEEGTEEAIRGPLEVLGEQLIQNEVRIQKNETAKAIIKLALEDPSLGVKKVSAVKPVAQVEGKPVFRPVGGDLPGTLSFFENGKRQIYKVPDFIDREAIMLNESMRHPVASLIGSLNGISRAAFTTFSPPFVVANMLNDMLTVFVTRGILPHQTARTLIRSLRGLEGDPVMQSFRLAGGYQMRFYGRGAGKIAREVGASGGQIVGTGPSFLRQLKGAIPKAGEIGEQSTRMAVYNKALDKTLPNWRSMTPEAVAATPQARVAAASSVESTINFARGGHLIKSLNPFIIFLNAAMEGTKLPFRSLRESAATRWRLAGVGAGQVGLNAYNLSYPEYFDIPNDIRWGSVVIMLPSKEKDIYGNPKPRYLTIVPRTREWAFFLAPTTFAMEKMFSDNPTEFGEFSGALAPMLSPLNEIPSPIAMAEMWEQAANYDLYRSRKIVPTEMQTVLPEDQTMPWTSRTIQEVANTVGISPIRLEHGFSGILGGAGRTFTSVTDYILNSLMPREVSPETQALVERYEALETPTERRSMVQELSSDQRKAMFNELRQPDPSIPVVSPIAGRVLRDRGGQLRLTREEQAAKLTGISPEQTRETGSLLQKVSDARLTMQQQIDRQLRDDTLPPDQRINPKEWRLERGNFSEQYKGVLRTLGVQFPGAAQIHKDGSVKTKYYGDIAKAAGSMVNPRMRGQAIAAGWYAIRAEGPEGTIGLEDVGAMFDERDQYREGLSPEDRSLLDAELESRMTPVEREYSRDMEVIRQSGYWDITDTLIDSQGIRDLWERYHEEPKSDRPVFLRNLMNKNPEQHMKFIDAQAVIDRFKHAKRTTNCDLDRNLLKWGYVSVPKCKDVIEELRARQLKKLREDGFNPDPVGVMNNGSSTGRALP